MKKSASFILIALALSPQAYAADPVSTADKNFVAMVSQGGMFEVKASELAAEQGYAQDIKDQASAEVHDHEIVGDKLKAAASDAGIELSDTLNDKFQKEYDELKALSGPTFDNVYLSDMEKIHAKDGAAFESEAHSGTNTKLKVFAAETHRIVLRHIGALRAVGPEKQLP